MRGTVCVYAEELEKGRHRERERERERERVRVLGKIL